MICMRSCPTWHGIRVIIGDVRGKGLDAILLARYVLSAFGRSAVAVPAMEQQGAPQMPRKSHSRRHDVVRTGTTYV